MADVMQEQKTREASMRALAESLEFSVEKSGERFTLTRTAELSRPAVEENLTLAEAEELLETWNCAASAAVSGRLLQRQREPAQIEADDEPLLLAGQREHRAALVGEHDGLRATHRGSPRAGLRIDSFHIGRPADVGHAAAEARLRRAEGKAIAQAADRQRIIMAVEVQHAAAGRTADHKARLKDSDADGGAVGLGGGGKADAGQHRCHRDKSCTKSGYETHGGRLLLPAVDPCVMPNHIPAVFRSAALMRSCQPGPSSWKKSSTSRSRRSDTISFTPGSDGAFAGCSAGLVVAALKAFSASERASPIGRRAMPLFITPVCPP